MEQKGGGKKGIPGSSNFQGEEEKEKEEVEEGREIPRSGRGSSKEVPQDSGPPSCGRSSVMTIPIPSL